MYLDDYCTFTDANLEVSDLHVMSFLLQFCSVHVTCYFSL